ncbi:unnamed protein product, partial [Ectocarpus sp. 12 AP-2014]
LAAGRPTGRQWATYACIMADSSEGREAQVSRSPTTVNKLDEAIEREVRPWLDLVDSLRAQGIQDELSLPQIAVMGDQSCGKSSVLEA